MLDGVDARAKRPLRGLRGVAVDRHPLADRVRLVDQGDELLGRVVAPPQLFLVAGGAARGRRLEEVDAEADLGADQPAHRPGPVGVDRLVPRPGVRQREVRVPARLPDPAGGEDARARHEPDLDGAPEGQHLEVERVDGAGQVPHRGEARLEHEPRVLRRVEREELGAGADLGPDRVGLVGVDHADEVDVEIHEPGHDRAAGDVKAWPSQPAHSATGATRSTRPSRITRAMSCRTAAPVPSQRRSATTRRPLSPERVKSEFLALGTRAGIGFIGLSPDGVLRFALRAEVRESHVLPDARAGAVQRRSATTRRPVGVGSCRVASRRAGDH